MKLKLSLTMAAIAATLLVGCSSIGRSDGIIGGMPGSGYGGADLSPQVLDSMSSGDTTVYEVGPDGIHHPPANRYAR